MREKNQLLPRATDLEDAVLGACMLDAGTFEQISNMLREPMFYNPENQLMFRAMFLLNAAGNPIDILTVVEKLKDLSKLDDAGGPYAVTKRTNAVVGTGNVEAHARIIQQKWINRQLHTLCMTIGQKAIDDIDCFDNVDELTVTVEKLLGGLGLTNAKRLMDSNIDYVKVLDKRVHTASDITGVPSGFADLDAITHGWQPTDLITIAARPSVGKTAFALNLARNACTHCPVGFWSLEMSMIQLAERIISSEANIYMDKLQTGQLTDDELNEVYKAMTRLEKLPLYIDDTAGLNVLDFRNKAKRLVKEQGIGLIVLDYLQLMYGVPDGERRNREQEISGISRELKKTAKQLGVPIIALSQLSRAVETRGGAKMPILSDLRESGAIEQDSDMVMFLYRPEYYEIMHNETGESTRGETFIRIAKHRNGILGNVKLMADLAVQKFHSSTSVDLLREKLLKKNREEDNGPPLDKYTFG